MPRIQLRTRQHNRIAFYRQAMQMTQEELAAEVGVHRDTLRSWEADRYFPSPEKVSRLARTLGCRARDLYPHDYF